MLEYIGKLLSALDTAHRHQVTELTEFELRELENLFALLLLGAFTGLPAPPSLVAVELLPYMERELRIVRQRAEDASDALAEMAGLLDIG
jgi:hypothetical protein